MPNGETLERARKSIDKLLNRDTLSPDVRAALEVQQIMLDFLEEFQGDHEKVQRMWIAFKAGMWMLAVLGSAIVLYFFDLLVHSQ